MNDEEKERQDQAKREHAAVVRRKRRRMALTFNRFIHTEDGKEVWDHLKEIFKLEGRIATPINLGTHTGYDTQTILLNEGARGVVIYLNDLAAEGTSGDGNIEEPEKKVIMP